MNCRPSNPKTIIIVGASSGVGNLVARHYIEAGCRVGVAARRVDPLAELQALAPERVVTAAIDVTAEDAADRLNALIARVGDVDVIFNAAGVGFANPDVDTAKNASIVATNCDGFTRIIDAAYLYFANSGRKGQIAAISSIAGTKGLGFAAAYSASKAYQSTYLTAMRQLASMRGLALTVTDIRPGFIDTPLLDPSRHYPMLMKPQRAARLIVNAIDRRRSVTTIDWRWAIVTTLWRLIPPCLWRRLPIKM